MTRDEAREAIYGEPFAQWKAKHHREATQEQLAAFAALQSGKGGARCARCAPACRPDSAGRWSRRRSSRSTWPEKPAAGARAVRTTVERGGGEEGGRKCREKGWP